MNEIDDSNLAQCEFCGYIEDWDEIPTANDPWCSDGRVTVCPECNNGESFKDYEVKNYIIKIAKESGLWPSVTDTFPNEIQLFADLVAAIEREACARVCDLQAEKDGFEGYYAHCCAIAIRTRGLNEKD